MTRQLRLMGSEDAFDAWSDAASQAESNTVYDAHFAVADGSARHRYELRAADGGYRLEVGLHTIVRGRIDAGSFSVATIDRCRPAT